MNKKNIELWVLRIIFLAGFIYFLTPVARDLYPSNKENDDCKKLVMTNYDLSISLRDANKTIDRLRADEQYSASQAEFFRNEKIIFERSLNEARQRFDKENEKFANSQQKIDELQVQIFYLNQAIRNFIELDKK